MAETMRLLLLILLLGAGPASAMALDPGEAAFAAALQKAVRNDDKTWLAAHVANPFRYDTGGASALHTPRWFLQHYAEVMSPRVKAAVLADPPERHGRTTAGAMIGAQKQYLNDPDGNSFDAGGYNIWFAYVSRDARLTHYRIITINAVNLARIGR